MSSIKQVGDIAQQVHVRIYSSSNVQGGPSIHVVCGSGQVGQVQPS